MNKVGIFVDVANINRNGGYGMQYNILRKFACRKSNSEAIRMNAYTVYDVEKSHIDDSYKKGVNGFFQTLREYGFKIIQKNVKWYQDNDGNKYGKANSDLDMAVDLLLQSDGLNEILLVTGDGDFTQVIRALQNKGLRVEVIGFDNVSSDLKRESDTFMSGYIIPGLLPIKKENFSNNWGEVGSFVRGYCSHFDSLRSFGYLRYMSDISSNLWITDSRDNDSPYKTAYFHISELDENINVKRIPNRDTVFEFRLAESFFEDKKDELTAKQIKIVS